MDRESKVKKDIIAVIFIFTMLSILSFVVSGDRRPDVDEKGRYYVERNSYGKGRKNIEIEAGIDNEKEKLNIVLEERQYSLDELTDVFEKASIKLEEIALSGNESIDNVKTDLNFISKIPDTSIKVSWQVEDNSIIDYSGHVDMSKAIEGSNPVMVKAVLMYGSHEAEHIFNVNVVKDKLTALERKKESLIYDVNKREEESRNSGVLVLPSKVNGEKVTWKYPKDSRASGVFMLGIVLAFGIYFESKQKIKKDKIKRDQIMMSDYPDIVNQLTLFLNAGMAISNAWRRIVDIYLRKKSYTGKRPAYEEMIYTLHEMNQGMSEQECYRQFGIRCDVASYRKLGTLLSSNLRKGNENITELLRKESFNAFEERKNAARKKGEEASTKLLGPMFIMLAVLLSIIVIPAFLSIQI